MVLLYLDENVNRQFGLMLLALGYDVVFARDVHPAHTSITFIWHGQPHLVGSLLLTIETIGCFIARGVIGSGNLHSHPYLGMLES